MTARPRLYFVVGEESGDALGADLIDAFRALGVDPVCHGLAGRRMAARGVESLFDITQISVMGISAVLARLPSLLRRIDQVARDVVAKAPDVLVLIDSPEFSIRVARKVREQRPGIRIVKYVAPSVWAWRPERAPKMARVIDHILALLPFEPAVLAELGGPPATYVGHPLARRIEAEGAPLRPRPADPPLVLVLPGSRRTETSRLLPDMAAIVAELKARAPATDFVLPAVPHLSNEIHAAVATWPVALRITRTEDEKLDAFRRADAAVAASGTVLLELALYGVPSVSVYRLDPIMNLARRIITGWSAALPNLILDEALIPERFGEMLRPRWVARHLQMLMTDTPTRAAQIDGLARLRTVMRQDEASGTIAARTILTLLDRARLG